MNEESQISLILEAIGFTNYSSECGNHTAFCIYYVFQSMYPKLLLLLHST